MKNLLVASLCASVLFSGCGSDSVTPNRGEDVLRKYGLETEGEPVITSTSLPTDFAEASWSQKSTACSEAGYDMTRYAGHNVSLIRYTLKEKYSYRFLMSNTTPLGSEGSVEIVGDLPLHLWVVVREQETVCGYVSVSDPDMEYLQLLAIGAFTSPFIAVNDEHIR